MFYFVMLLYYIIQRSSYFLHGQQAMSSKPNNRIILKETKYFTKF